MRHLLPLSILLFSLFSVFILLMGSDPFYGYYLTFSCAFTAKVESFSPPADKNDLASGKRRSYHAICELPLAIGRHEA